MNQMKNKTKAEKRVAIAKDVIKQIRAGKLRAKAANGYICPTTPAASVCLVAFSGSDLPLTKGDVDALQGSCEVCALGSMVLSRIRKFNSVVGDQLTPDGDVYEENAYGCLGDIFTSNQLEAIEAVFEGYDYTEWREEHYNDNDLLLAIMQNIVDNNGKFKPKEVYVVQ